MLIAPTWLKMQTSNFRTFPGQTVKEFRWQVQSFWHNTRVWRTYGLRNCRGIYALQYSLLGRATVASKKSNAINFKKTSQHAGRLFQTARLRHTKSSLFFVNNWLCIASSCRLTDLYFCVCSVSSCVCLSVCASKCLSIYLYVSVRYQQLVVNLLCGSEWSQSSLSLWQLLTAHWHLPCALCTHVPTQVQVAILLFVYRYCNVNK